MEEQESLASCRCCPLSFLPPLRTSLGTIPLDLTDLWSPALTQAVGLVPCIAVVAPPLLNFATKSSGMGWVGDGQESRVLSSWLVAGRQLFPRRASSTALSGGSGIMVVTESCGGHPFLTRPECCLDVHPSRSCTFRALGTTPRLPQGETWLSLA